MSWEKCGENEPKQDPVSEVSSPEPGQKGHDDGESEPDEVDVRTDLRGKNQEQGGGEQEQQEEKHGQSGVAGGKHWQTSGIRTDG